MQHGSPLRVVHLVDALGGTDRFWGKESVVAMLMREQRASGSIDPVLVTFGPGHLGKVLLAEGFQVHHLMPGPSRGAGPRTLRALAAVLTTVRPDVVHTHGYRANIVGRIARALRLARGKRLVSTCHGWVETTRALRVYNALDRWTSALSDVVTVPDPRMIAALRGPGRRVHVANGVPDAPPHAPATDEVERAGALVAGTLGRVTEEKGIRDVLAVAATFPDPGVVFSIAGEGALTGDVRAAGANVRYAGFYDRPERFLAALDVYVQASHAEGLSLALLEAMRAGKAIVATDVGATRDAVVDGESALLVRPRDVAGLREAVLRLARDGPLRARLGRNARERFAQAYRIGRQHECYLELYTTGGR